jgi:hypothetical protein
VEFDGAPRLELTDQLVTRWWHLPAPFSFFMERVFDPSFLFFHINGSRFAVSGETGSAILYIDLD